MPTMRIVASRTPMVLNDNNNIMMIIDRNGMFRNDSKGSGREGQILCNQCGAQCPRLQGRVYLEPLLGVL